MGFSVGSLIGAGNLNVADSNTQNGVTVPPAFALGTTVPLNDGGHAIYVQASELIDANAACVVMADGTAKNLTTTTSAESKRVAWAQCTVPSAYYAWVQTGGNFVAKLAANCADNVPLYATATAGVLDDATVSGGLVGGVISTVSIGSASAVTLLGAYAPFIVSGNPVTG